MRLRPRRASNMSHRTAMDMLGRRVIGNGMVAFSIGYLARGYSNAEISIGLRTIGTRLEISGTTCAVIGSRRDRGSLSAAIPERVRRAASVLKYDAPHDLSGAQFVDPCLDVAHRLLPH